MAAVDLFSHIDSGRDPVLYCRAGRRFEQAHLHQLCESGVEQLYVRASDFYDFSRDLLESLDSLLQRDAVPQTEKYAALQVAVAVEIEQSFRMVDCGKFCRVAEKIGHDLVNLLAGSDVIPRELFQIARHDFNTFTHATNVASYSIMLAERLGMTDERVLQQIACAAILHDIGKRFIPPQILSKPGRLDREEREIIETHPLRGYEELCQRTEFEFSQLMMVYQHHERVDGTGYPVRVLREEIHLWARLLSVVDVFDALTARRCYRERSTIDSALDYLRERSGTHFDPEIVKCWVTSMKPG
jgi:HD-GYP domain-containing protein (c-di-GMP phosphodiesterase class II)